MAKRARNKRSTARRPRRSSSVKAPREIRAAYSELQKGVAHLDTSIADLRAGLLRAERSIEANARRRISALRKDARAELRALQARQREAARTMRKLSGAAGESWREIKRSADSLLADARKAAAAIGKRFRSALKS